MIRIYTDASAREGFKPGFAVIVTRKGKFVECVAGLSSRQGSKDKWGMDVHVAEARGVVVGLLVAARYGAGCTVFTDSAVVVECVELMLKGESRDRVAQRLQTTWYRVASFAIIEIVNLLGGADLSSAKVKWIPKGSDKWNVLADEAANQARLMGNDPKVPDEDKYYWLDRVGQLCQPDFV